jgi:hypothetical protein
MRIITNEWLQVYTAGVGLLALPLLYVLSMCGASAIVFYLDKAFMNGAFVKWVKYSGNQVTKSILPIYRYTLLIVPFHALALLSSHTFSSAWNLTSHATPIADSPLLRHAARTTLELRHTSKQLGRDERENVVSTQPQHTLAADDGPEEDIAPW